MTNDNRRHTDIRLFAVLASLLITIFTIAVPDTPNDDAYTYIRTAEIFLADGPGASFQHYEWAGYPVLIALTSQLGFSLFTAAYMINGLFYALLIYAYLSIVRLMDGSRLVMLMAALCVLLYPQLNEYRYLIIRDIGFWAFSLFALWQFLRYTETCNIKFAFSFSLALLVAAGFRAEAVVYLLLTPPALLFDVRHSKQVCRRAFLQLMTVVLASLLGAALILASLGVNIVSLFVDFILVYEPFINSTFNPTEAESSEMGRAIFGEHAGNYSRDYLMLFLAAGLLVILFAHLFNGIGGPFFWLLVYGGFRKVIRIERGIAVPIAFYLLINAVTLFGFLYITRYLSSRYAMLFCLMLALAVPLVLARVIESVKGRSFENIGARVLILFFAYCGFDSFITFGDSKDFVFDSVEWIEEQTGDDTRLITNNHAIAYFSGRVEDYDRTDRFISEAEIRQARVDDLIALEMHYEMSELVDSEPVHELLQLQAAFPSLEDRQIVIYKRVNP